MKTVLRALLVAIGIASTPVRALEITTENNPPFNYLDGQRVSGISTEIVVELARRARVPVNIQLVPWARAYQTALTTPGTCVYSIVRLPERESLFKWIGPIAANKWALFARSDFPKTISSLDEAREYRIGGVIQDAKYQYLQSLGFSNFDLVADENLNLGKLMAGRIDLWIAGIYRGRELADQMGVTGIKPVFVVREVEYYLACHPDTSPETLARLGKTLQILHKEGYVKSVANRFADRLKP